MKKTTFLMLIISLSLTLFNCSNDEASGNEPEKRDTKKKELVVREQSEMAALMLQMYSFNESIKEEIAQSAEEVAPFPRQFERIQKAELTEGKTRGENYDELAMNYLESQRMIHDSDMDKKEAFNKMVSSCIACHKQMCSGPIPKIEKLYIGEGL